MQTHNARYPTFSTSTSDSSTNLQIARHFPLSLYWVIGLSAHDEDELDDAWCTTRLTEDGGAAADVGTGLSPGGLAARGVPLGINFLGDRRNVNANTLGCLFPFSLGDIQRLGS